MTETRKFSRNIRRRWVLSYFFSFILSFFLLSSLALCGTQEEWTAVWWLYFKCDLSAPIAASSQLFLLSFNLLLSFPHHHLAGLVYILHCVSSIPSDGWMVENRMEQQGVVEKVNENTRWSKNIRWVRHESISTSDVNIKIDIQSFVIKIFVKCKIFDTLTRWER